MWQTIVILVRCEDCILQNVGSGSSFLPLRSGAFALFILRLVQNLAKTTNLTVAKYARSYN